MSRVLNVARMHLLDRWNLIYVPSLIFLGAWVVSTLIAQAITFSYTIISDSGTVSSSGSINGTIQALFWSLLAIAVVSVTRTFPFSFALSITRRTYFLGTELLIFGYSMIGALVLAVLAQIESATNGFGLGTTLQFLNISFVTVGSFPIQFLAFFGLFVFFFNTGFWVGALFKRFAFRGLAIFATVAVIIAAAFIITTTYSSSWSAVFEWLLTLTPLKIALGLTTVALVEATTSWLLLRGATP